MTDTPAVHTPALQVFRCNAWPGVRNYRGCWCQICFPASIASISLQCATEGQELCVAEGPELPRRGCWCQICSPTSIASISLQRMAEGQGLPRLLVPDLLPR